MLRVYLTDINGKTASHDYELDGSHYDKIIKTEILEETSKVKTWSGSKFVGIPEVDEQLEKEDDNQYEKFDYKIHDTDNHFYWVSALCSNCNETTQVTIKQGEKVNKLKIKNTPCGKCGCNKTLCQARYDGQKYVRMMK